MQFQARVLTEYPIERATPLRTVNRRPQRTANRMQSQRGLIGNSCMQAIKLVDLAQQISTNIASNVW
jgi:hypothetical protein